MESANVEVDCQASSILLCDCHKLALAAWVAFLFRSRARLCQWLGAKTDIDRRPLRLYGNEYTRSDYSLVYDSKGIGTCRLVLTGLILVRVKRPVFTF
jgi:hypothetical protein